MGKKQFDLRGLGGSYDFTATQPESFILILNDCAPLLERSLCTTSKT